MPHTPDPIQRREAIRRVALALGGTLSAPAVLGVLAGCGADGGAPSGTVAGWTPRALTDVQVEQVATIAEHVLPETDTPGARAVGVHRFVDTMLADHHTPEERARFVDGLAAVDARAARAHGTALLRCRPADQLALLQALDAETFAPRASDDAAPQAVPDAAPAFFRTLKELTLLGYYTSQPGATRELRHVPVPGRFEGCVPLARVGRAWAV